MLYAYFDSKDDLLLELMRMGYAEQLEAVEAVERAYDEPEDNLLGMTRAWWEFAIDSPDLYQVMYGLGGVSFPVTELQREGEKISDVLGSTIKEVLTKNNKAPEDIGGKVALLWSTAHGLISLNMAGRIIGGNEETERLLDQAVRDYLSAWLKS